MRGISGSSPWRRPACAAGCVIVLFVVAGSLRASDSQPQPTAVRAQTSHAVLQIDHAPQVAHAQQQSPVAATPAVSPQRALVNRYCIGCHNEKLKTGGLVLATVDVDSVSADNAEVLEKVVRKLQARAMPPRGMPRPDEAAYQASSRTWRRRLIGCRGQPESRASRHAPPAQSHRISERRPRPARPRGGCRGHSAERRLGHGFDNVSLGGLSPTLLERYLGASQKISRLAVGTPVRSPGEETVVLPTGSDAGRLFRRTALRHACGRGRALRLSGRWRIRLPAATDAGSQRSHRRADRASSDRGQHRRRTAAALHSEPDAGLSGSGSEPWTILPAAEQADAGLDCPRGGKGRTARDAGRLPQEVFGA